MTFIKYTNDGKAVIQPAALTLSNLDSEDILELHTLDNAIVLLKKEMTPVEKCALMQALMRLVNTLTVDMMTEWDEQEDCGDENDEDFCDDVISIPVEAFEDAGIWGEDLRVHVTDGAVIITPDDDSTMEPSKKMQAISKHMFEAAVSLTKASELVDSGDTDD